MLESDFKTYGLVDFSPEEIKGTGATIESIKFELLIRFQNFRNLMGRSVNFINNGLSTGAHKTPYHIRGLAGDFFLNTKEGEIKILAVFKAALESGFKGIGVYWNGKSYSFHFDLRPKYAFWAATKDNFNNWDYHKLIADPRELVTSTYTNNTKAEEV